MLSGGLEAAAGKSTLPERSRGSVAETAPRTSIEEGDVVASATDVVRPLRVTVSNDLSRENALRARSTERWQQRVTTAIVTGDVVAAGASSAAGYFTGFGLVDVPSGAVAAVTAVLFPLAWVCACWLGHAYDQRFVTTGRLVYSRAGRAFLQLAVVLAFAGYFLPSLFRGFPFLALVPTLLLGLGVRAAARSWLLRERLSGRSMTPVLAVGSAVGVAQLANALRSDLGSGMYVAAACVPAAEVGDPGVRRRLGEAGVPIAGDFESVGSSIEQCKARSVAVVAGEVVGDDLRRIAWELEARGTDLIVSTGLPEIGLPRLHVDHVGGTPLLRVDSPQFTGLRRIIKGLIDRTAALIGLLVLSPLIIVLAVLIRCTSSGPAFFLQTRIGRGGKPFRMVKFRSMYVDAEHRLAELRDLNETDGPLFKIRDDPRVTSIGRLLRRSSLDEIPQLLNILTGSMSLVGPRPPLPSEVEQYDANAKRRLLVKPGLTGLWQVSGRSDLSWEDSVRLDLHYVENWSLSLDMVLLLKTAKVVVRATGAY